MARVSKKDQSKERKSTKKGKKNSGVSFKLYIFKVLQQVYPDMNITEKSMKIMNCFVLDLFERVAQLAAELTKMDNRKTMNSWDIQAGVRLVLKGGELTKHAVSEGTKAVVKCDLWDKDRRF